MVLNHLIQQKIIKKLFRKINFKIQEESIIAIIHAEKYIQTNDKFDRQKFESFLVNANLTEDQYIKEVGFMFALGSFYSVFSDPALSYSKLAKRLYDSEYEERTIGISKTANTYNTETPGLKEGEILEFYEKNKSGFRTLECRYGQYFLVSRKNIKPELITIEDQEIEEKFKMMELDKTFDIDYISFASLDEVKKAKDSIEDNFDLYKNDIKHLSTLKRPEFLTWMQDETTWNQGEWRFVMRNKQFYLARLTKVQELSDKHAQSELKEKLKTQLETEKLTSALEVMEEELLNGKTFKDLLQKYGGQLYVFDNVTEDGAYKSGEPSFLTKRDLSIVFQVQKGKASEFFYTLQDNLVGNKDRINDEYASIVVDNVEKAKQKPFTDVREEIISFLQQKQKDKILMQMTEANVESSNFDTKIKVYRSNINREKNPEQDLPDGFLDAVFDLKSNGTTKAFFHAGYFIVGKLLDRQKPQESTLITSGIEHHLKAQLAQFFIAELTHHYNKKFGLKINKELIKDFL